jgi:hypothetical protein
VISAEIHSVATDSSQKNFFAVLTANKNGEDRWLPVRLGAAEAVSIATEINDQQQQRPGSHDLIAKFIRELGGEINRIEINRKDGELESTVEISTEDGSFSLEARPSDALAVAVRLNTDISVDENLLRESSGQFEEYFENVHPSSEVTQLQYELKKAVEQEDYERAAELRNEIQSAMRKYDESMDLKDEIEAELESAFGDEKE